MERSIFRARSAARESKAAETNGASRDDSPNPPQGRLSSAWGRWSQRISPVWRVTAEYTGVLVVLGGLSVASYTTTSDIIEEERLNAHQINLSGRQRMLSQRITLLTQRLVDTPNAEKRAITRPMLVETIREMRNNHASLTSRPLSPQLQALYFGGNKNLDRDLDTFLQDAERIAEAGPSLPWLEALAAHLSEHSTVLLSDLDAVVNRYQLESERRATALRGRLILVITLTFLVLILSALTVFNPLARQMRREMAAVSALQKRHAGILESALDCIVSFDAQGHVIDFNPAAEQTFGYSREEAVGRDIVELIIPPEERERYRRSLAHYLSTGQNNFLGRRFERTAMRADGSTFPAEFAVNEVRLDGQPIFTAYLRDISQQKEHERKERLAASVFETVSQGIIVTNAEERIIAVNAAFSRITGYAPEDVMGQKPKVLRSGLHDQDFYVEMKTILRTTGSWEGEIWNRAKNGRIFPEWLTITTVRDGEGRTTGYIAVLADITDRKHAEEMVWRQANYDSLTGLPNRTHFLARLANVTMTAIRENRRAAILFVDLDHFKWINDTLGHTVGDELLRQAAARLTHCVRANDIVARLGGDEFTVILPDIRRPDDAEAVARKIVEALSLPFQIGETEATVSASVGITIFPDDAASPDELIKNADSAMYEAKSVGRRTYRFFTAEMQRRAQERVALEQDLRRALAHDEFEMHYQPIVELGTGRMVGAEALLRWNHPVRGKVYPMDFIGLAEETGLIVQIGEWTLGRAAQDAKAWRTLGLTDFYVSVNLSARQFRDQDVPARIRETVEAERLPPDALRIEITESVLMEDLDRTRQAIRELNAGNIVVMIDDFGTGYSSLSYLDRFQVSFIKIDRSFVQGCTDSTGRLHMIQAIIAMAHALDLRTIAEGVETEAEADLLRQLGCDYAQGWLFGKAVRPEYLLASVSVKNGKAVIGAAE